MTEGGRRVKVEGRGEEIEMEKGMERGGSEMRASMEGVDKASL